MYAAHNINFGDQIFMNYGNKSNLDMMLHHSVFEIGNIKDCIFFSLTAKNPYWLLVAEKLFGYNSDLYENCLPVTFQPDYQVIKEIRTLVATDKELDSIESILQGTSISLENEVHMLRALYYAINYQTLSPLETLPEPNGDLAVEFWNLYTKEHQRAIELLLQRILDLWQLYLG